MRKMWWDIRFDPEPFENSAIDECLKALRETRIHGGILLGCFRVSEHKVFDWFASRNRLDEANFFRQFFVSPTVAVALPELRTEGLLLDGDGFFGLPEFEWGSSFTLDGEIAEKLVIGGCHMSFPGTPTEAKELGDRFCKAIFGERYTETQVYRSFDRWHEWFSYVEHLTWLLIDKRYRRIWLLCLTDND